MEKTSGKQIVMVILDHFADWEGAFLSSALLSGYLGEGHQVIWASSDQAPKRSFGGLTVIPDVSLADIPTTADALIVIGGTSWRTPEAAQVVPVVRSFLERGKIIGFICDAARFAAWNGLLNGVIHTGNNPQEMIESPEYTNPQGFRFEEVVHDGQIITANGNSPIPFARSVLLALEIASREAIDEWYDFYTLGYWNALKKFGYMTE